MNPRDLNRKIDEITQMVRFQVHQKLEQDESLIEGETYINHLVQLFEHLVLILTPDVEIFDTAELLTQYFNQLHDATKAIIDKKIPVDNQLSPVTIYCQNHYLSLSWIHPKKIKLFCQIISLYQQFNHIRFILRQFKEEESADNFQDKIQHLHHIYQLQLSYFSLANPVSLRQKANDIHALMEALIKRLQKSGYRTSDVTWPKEEWFTKLMKWPGEMEGWLSALPEEFNKIDKYRQGVKEK